MKRCSSKEKNGEISGKVFFFSNFFLNCIFFIIIIMPILLFVFGGPCVSWSFEFHFSPSKICDKLTIFLLKNVCHLLMHFYL